MAAGIPNQPGAQAPAQHSGVYGSSPQSTTVPPKLVPIARTNSLMVIASAEELEYIGLDDIFGETAIQLIEWPERAEGRLPEADVVIRIRRRDAGRVIEVESRDR